jgi:hypothetical protein
MQRIGLSKFLVRLEYEHFHPSSNDNDLFNLRMMRWPVDFGLIWCVVEIPSGFKKLALELMNECGLRAADGVPNLLGEKIEVFPISGDNVFTIEYVKDNLAYKASQDELNELKKKEHEEVQAILSQEREKYIHELSLNYSQDQVKKILAEEERKAELQLKNIKEKLQ